jgi:DNA-binding GntR family transcriptional regulator
MATNPKQPDESSAMARDGATMMNRACMHRRIRDVLVTRILDGSYPPEFRFKELTLAREFDVSQGPVREALRELEALGLVTSEHYRGTRVRGVDVEEMREAYDLRALIEARAAEVVAADPGDVCDFLAAQLEEMRLAMEARDDERLADAALRFHRRLVEASGNRTFLSTWDSFHWDVRARVTLRRIASVHRDIGVAYEPHVAIIDRLRAGDGVGAAAAVRRNFELFIGLLQPSSAAAEPSSRAAAR